MLHFKFLRIVSISVDSTAVSMPISCSIQQSSLKEINTYKFLF